MATMMSSSGLRGIEGYRVEVEVQLLPGKSGMNIIGLPDASVKESKDRVVAALFVNQFFLPHQKVIINLSPAEQRKNTPLFDLPIAIGIMKETGYFKEIIPNTTAFLGVLSLDGQIKSVEGMLPAILAAKRAEFETLFLPFHDSIPFQAIEGIDFKFVNNLKDVVQILSGQQDEFIASKSCNNKQPLLFPTTKKTQIDFKQIYGHKQTKRALEIAATGGHNVLMSGPPGCGKSMLAEAFPTILPPLSQEKQLEVMSLYHIAGMDVFDPTLSPFRSPHHSSSSISLIGGGSHPRPGEISLAHNGVMFLDEMAEFPKRTLDMLRQPLEAGKVTISRATSTVTFPTQFILIGAMNPCPCGYYDSKTHYCTCTPKEYKNYHNRISGPILDRMDLYLQLQYVELDKETKSTESSKYILERVIQARDRQYERYGKEICNASVPIEVLHELSPITKEQQRLLNQWSSKQNWSSRTQVKTIRLARTIADLKIKKDISIEDLWEAMSLRRFKEDHKQRHKIK